MIELSSFFSNDTILREGTPDDIEDDLLRLKIRLGDQIYFSFLFYLVYLTEQTV